MISPFTQDDPITEEPRPAKRSRTISKKGVAAARQESLKGTSPFLTLRYSPTHLPLDEDFEEDEDSDNSVVSLKVGPPSGTKSKVLKVPKPSKKKRKGKASTAPPPEVARSESPEPAVPTEILRVKSKGYVASFHVDDKQYILVDGTGQPVGFLYFFRYARLLSSLLARE